MDNIRFKGIMPALITPFDENGAIKSKAVNQLIDWHLSEGVQGFYICGTTGEGPAISAESRMKMAEVSIGAVKGRGIIIDHIGAPDIHDALRLTRHASQIGAAAIASLPPAYFFKYTEDEVVEYYKTIAGETDLPVLVYATSMTSAANLPRFIGRLMEIPNVIGAKFSIRDYYEMRRVKEVNGGNINLINGPDETLLCGLVMGADGGIGSTYNIMPGWFVGLYKAFTDGDLKTAQEYQYRINRVISVLLRYGVNGVVNSTKAALGLMGYDVGHAVYPAKTYSNQELADLRNELEKLGIQF